MSCQKVSYEKLELSLEYNLNKKTLDKVWFVWFTKHGSQ